MSRNDYITMSRARSAAVAPPAGARVEILVTRDISSLRFGRPSRRGVSRNGVLAEKFHILTSTGALNLQLFDCKYEDVRKAAVLQMLEAIFSKH